MTHVSQIGPVPSWIKALRAPGYKNIFELGIDPPTIFGTEHLFGDWNGDLLLLAQDFAPAEEVRALVQRGLPAEKVYRHNDGDGRFKTGYRTNSRLVKFLGYDKSALSGHRATTSGILYGSACFFLKEGETSDALKGFSKGRPAFDGSAAVLKYVVSNMKNLKTVVCLGGTAHQMVQSTGIARSVPTYAVPHPSRGADITHQTAWKDILERRGKSK
ncbi:hypothetical protein [Asticcacaulis solisilvae]|uniref:hypothetical protein n=1 Tax=Asticcacaulis solisilvae TaxID=1217274 RepID=UPI003FD808E1